MKTKLFLRLCFCCTSSVACPFHLTSPPSSFQVYPPPTLPPPRPCPPTVFSHPAATCSHPTHQPSLSTRQVGPMRKAGYHKIYCAKRAGTPLHPQKLLHIADPHCTPLNCLTTWGLLHGLSMYILSPPNFSPKSIELSPMRAAGSVV